MNGSGVERIVVRAEDVAVGLLAVSEAVVVADYGDVGHAAGLHDVAAPYELFGQAKVGHVAAVDHEGDVAAAAYLSDGVLKLVVGGLSVGQKGELEGRLQLHGLNLGHVFGDDVRVAVNLCGIGVALEVVAAGEEESQCRHHRHNQISHTPQR